MPEYLPPAVAAASKAYHTHHMACRVCIAAGLQRTDERCDTGADLHRAYVAAQADMPPLPPWKPPRAKKP